MRDQQGIAQWFNMGNTLSVYELHKDIKIIYIILASALFYSKLLSYHGDPLQSIIFIIGCMWYDWLMFIFLAKKSEEIFFKKGFQAYKYNRIKKAKKHQDTNKGVDSRIMVLNKKKYSLLFVLFGMSLKSLFFITLRVFYF